MTKAVHAYVSGQVQQVGYRQSCRQMERSLGLVGWLWAGPSVALVAGVESDVVAPDQTLRDFFIYSNPMKSV